MSRWESALEGATADGEARDASAVRLGLREIRGFPQAAALRIEAARANGPFGSLNDLAHRGALGRRELELLAGADALKPLAGHRRQVAWRVAGVCIQGDLFDVAPPSEAPVPFPRPGEGEELVADYVASGYTLGRHPLALLRARLTAHRFLPAIRLAATGDRALVRAAGLVTCRQRPGTASGVIFVTLEDETGMTNVVIYADLAERARRALLCARLLGVYGLIQREGPVVHVMAKRLLDLTPWLGALPTVSRDFH